MNRNTAGEHEPHCPLANPQPSIDEIICDPQYWNGWYLLLITPPQLSSRGCLREEANETTLSSITKTWI